MVPWIAFLQFSLFPKFYAVFFNGSDPDPAGFQNPDSEFGIRDPENPDPEANPESGSGFMDFTWPRAPC